MSLLIEAISKKHGLKKSFVESAWRSCKKELKDNGDKGNYVACVEALKVKLGLETKRSLPEKSESVSLDNFTLDVVESGPNVTLCKVRDCPDNFKKHLTEESMLLIRSSDLIETTSSGSVGGPSAGYQTINVNTKKKRKNKKGSSSLYSVEFSDEALEEELARMADDSTEGIIESSCSFCSHVSCKCSEIVENITETVEFDNNLSPKDLDAVYKSIGTIDSEDIIDSGDKIDLQDPPNLVRNTGDGGSFDTPSVSLETSSDDGIEDLVDSDEEAPLDIDGLEDSDDLDDDSEEEVSLETSGKDEERESIVYAESTDNKDRMSAIHETLFGNAPTKKVSVNMPKRKKNISESKPKDKEDTSSQAERLSGFFNQF
jgi:hypothetical protein